MQDNTLFPLEPKIAGNGLPDPTPNRWRYEHDPVAMAAVQAFFDDLLWNFQLELENVRWWPGRRRRSADPSLTAAVLDLARLWHLETSPHAGPRRRDA